MPDKLSPIGPRSPIERPRDRSSLRNGTLSCALKLLKLISTFACQHGTYYKAFNERMNTKINKQTRKGRVRNSNQLPLGLRARPIFPLINVPVCVSGKKKARDRKKDEIRLALLPPHCHLSSFLPTFLFHVLLWSFPLQRSCALLFFSFRVHCACFGIVADDSMRDHQRN